MRNFEHMLAASLVGCALVAVGCPEGDIAFRGTVVGDESLEKSTASCQKRPTPEGGATPVRGAKVELSTGGGDRTESTDKYGWYSVSVFGTLGLEKGAFIEVKHGAFQRYKRDVDMEFCSGQKEFLNVRLAPSDSS